MEDLRYQAEEFNQLATVVLLAPKNGFAVFSTSRADSTFLFFVFSTPLGPPPTSNTG